MSMLLLCVATILCLGALALYERGLLPVRIILASVPGLLTVISLRNAVSEPAASPEMIPLSAMEEPKSWTFATRYVHALEEANASKDEKIEQLKESTVVRGCMNPWRKAEYVPPPALLPRFAVEGFGRRNAHSCNCQTAVSIVVNERVCVLLSNPGGLFCDEG